MITAELKSLALNLSDEDMDEEDDSPSTPKGDDGLTGDPDTGDGAGDGFGLDGDLIETPGEEDF